MNQPHDDEKALHDFYDPIEASPAPPKSTKKQIKKSRFITIFIILFVLGSLFFLFVLPMYYCNYTTRTRLGEGLVLASSAKNLVDDNIVNGFSPAKGWTGVQPTENTQAIMIDPISGVILIVGDPQRAGGVVLALIPVDRHGQQLIAHQIPQDDIRWSCYIVTQGTVPINQIPTECRTMMSETY